MNTDRPDYSMAGIAAQACRTRTATEVNQASQFLKVASFPDVEKQPQREIPGLITALQDQIAQLEVKFDHLSSRVSAVTSQPIPQPVTQTEPARQLTTTTVSDLIEKATARLRALSIAIGDLDSRIQL